MFNITQKLTSIFTNIANALRVKLDIESLIKADDIPDIMNTYFSDNILIEKIINHTIKFLPSIYTQYCTKVGRSWFTFCTQLKSVNFPICSQIGQYAFKNCSALTDINFPLCESIGAEAFNGCINLTSINFPAISTPISIGYSAFSNTNLTTVILSGIQTINSIFSGYQQLTNVDCAICSTIESSAFMGCTKLTNISFPSCKTIFNSAFYSCNSLISINLPMCERLYNAFVSCRNLTTVYLPSFQAFYGAAFYGCHNLISLYLLGSSVPVIFNVNLTTIFSSTPIGGYSNVAGRYGSIFVPASLVNDYKTHDYWSVLADHIVAYEPEEN